ncbi:ATP-binding protein [Flavobacterium sp. CYK-4]|uniref:ATP-binding protein n=1 Tax=Flavobacterium lotistagni TaxID=2709660 RepID=UPI001408ACE8|nr:ATP-binding protein [Flavobacterium lotistagni]NHM08026.1 ATP-binding protein [Flavobacterium lotistagni]
MNNISKHTPHTFIKNIAIGLPDDFKFINIPNGTDKKSNKNFIGRKAQIIKFLSFLNSSNKGVYLITGYRGMGKTSFVNHVLYQYQKKSNLKKLGKFKNRKKIIPLHLTISQNAPKESDVLKQVVSSINDSFGRQKNKTFDLIFASKYFFLYALLLVFGYKLFIHLCKIQVKDIFLNHIDFSTIVLFIFPLIILHCFELFYKNQNKAYNRISNLMERCFSEVSHENASETNVSLIKDFGLKLSNKKNKTYNVANTKEIEFELIQFLREAQKEHYEFIFIFDELDKIELNSSNHNLNDELDHFENKNAGPLNNHIRNRKKAVLNIITGLKNFFTTAEARFVFIAGREMFDASLADISDKQSPLSSIFTFIFHIETLLKEIGNNHKNYFSLSIAIEEFIFEKQLSHQGCPIGSIDEFIADYKNRNRASKNVSEEAEKIYFTILNFITYLIYRSSGSPKKLIQAFHEFVKPSEVIERDEQNHFLIKANDMDSKYFLYFNSSEQYRISFINSIYRPFIIQYGKSYKSFSENSVISIPYYFDHLFKFHPFAFSMSNLELIPDLITINKTINLREDISQVIQYLLKSHVRNTDIELFDYKFHSKTANEIAYISKIFETEEAAFNFTLDESYPAKMLLSDKIKEYRSIHSRYKMDSDVLNPQIFSIANLNSSLGDIYFFDQEFHEAICCYSDAIRSINNLKIHKINFRDFIGLIRNKLKLGLCFEKIYSFEEALSFYSDCIQDIKRFYKYYLKNAEYFNFSGQTNELNKPFFTSSLNDLQQISIQAFLANIYIQEKMGQEGITTARVKAEMADFYRITDFISLHSGRNNIIIANSMLHLAKLLYYKNSSVHTADYTDDYTNQYPIWYQKLYEQLTTLLEPIKYQFRRQPILALMTYLIGLDEIMKSRDFFINQPIKNELLCLSVNQNPNGVNAVILIYIELIEKFFSSNSGGKEAFISNHLRYMASFLSSIGDCLLCLKDHSKTQKVTKINLNDIYKGAKTGSFITGLNTSPLALMLKCYYYSAKLYEKNGQISSAQYQYQKIIQVLSHVLTDDADSIATPLFNDIILPALDLYYTSLGQSQRHIIKKSKEDEIGQSDTTTLEQTDALMQQIYKLPNHQDIKETLLYFKRLLLKVQLDPKPKAIAPSVSSQHLRVLELEYNSRVLARKLKSEKTDAVSFISYIYNQSSILRIFKIYGSDYIFGPSFNAHIHYKMAKTIQDNKTLAQDPDLIHRIDELIGGHSYSALDVDYHYRRAVDYYNIAIELHTAGQEYNRKMREMVYLEDDFNDHRFHFGAALERYYMMHNVYQDKIEEIKKELKK